MSGDVGAALRGRPDKQKTIAALHKIYEIAERLYRKAPTRFKPVYGWIGAMVKHRRDLSLVLRAIERVAEKEEGRHGGLPVQEVVPYLGGALRKLEQEAEAEKIRSTGATIGEMLGPLLKNPPSSSASGGGKRGIGE